MAGDLFSVRATIRLDRSDDFRRVAEAKARQIAEEAGRLTIEKLRSYTSKRSRPIRAGAPWRPQHPGGWADITHDLEKSYSHRVEDRGGVFYLLLENTSGHALAVEKKEGLFVLSGVDERGGIADKAIRQAVASVPDVRSE